LVEVEKNNSRKGTSKRHERGGGVSAAFF
jgi:hypothetical protein